jgi:hypothetical protein
MYSQSSSGSMDNYGCCNRDNTSGNVRRRRRRSDPDAILKASTGFFGPTTIPITTALLTTPINQPIASVTVDTDALDDPTILVQFLGTLTTTALAAAGLTFNFTLFRQCRGMIAREQLRTFTVTQGIAVAAFPDSRSLSFAFSETDGTCFKHECCTYTLELTSVTGTVAVVVTVTVTGTLSVLVVGEEDDR